LKDPYPSILRRFHRAGCRFCNTRQRNKVKTVVTSTRVPAFGQNKILSYLSII
jgi:hypothetical protein